MGLNHFYNLEILSQKSCAPNSNPGMAITLLCGIGQLSCSPLSFMRIHHLQRAKWLSPWSGTSLLTSYISCPSHTLSFIHVTALAIAMVALNLAHLSVYAQEQVQDTQEVQYPNSRYNQPNPLLILFILPSAACARRDSRP